MKRATQILLGILLGALATGAGIGIFLAKANSDRRALADRLTETQKQAERSREENRLAIEEANRKLTEANEEVTKAQNIIEMLGEERRLMASADPLPSPSSFSTYRWSEAVSVDLGISLKIPLGTEIAENTKEAMLADVENQSDSLWLSVMPYTHDKELEWRERLQSTSTVSFVIHDRLITGHTGPTALAKDPNYVLRIQKKGEPSHLIWIRDPSGRTGAQNRVENILATMTFDSM